MNSILTKNELLNSKLDEFEVLILSIKLYTHFFFEFPFKYLFNLPSLTSKPDHLIKKLLIYSESNKNITYLWLISKLILHNNQLGH